MFFQGSLQEGISTAVGQQKPVLCFVTDDNEEGQTWENEFLTDSSLNDLIKNQAVALRLTAGSEEAGYLAQIFPLPKAPTVVIMKHGDLKEYITPGTTKEEFIRRVQTAFSATSKPAPASTPQASGSAEASSSTSPGQPSSAASSSPQTQQSDSVRRVLADREAARVQAQKAEAERKAKEERARAKQPATSEAGADTSKKRQLAEAAKTQRQKQRDERARVLKLIADDKEERRARAAEREQARAEGQKQDDGPVSSLPAPETKLPSTTKAGDTAYVQVRLSDGSTIRSRFKAASPLAEVRKFVDENRTDGSSPYKLKQVLSPLPNKTIDDTEETKSLGDLGLSPSSTLVLVPVPKFTSAYVSRPSNIFSEIFGLITAFFAWLLAFVGLGGQSRTAQPPAGVSSRAPETSSAQGVQNPNDRRREQQFYNGNSLSFEPRPDEDDK